MQTFFVSAVMPQCKPIQGNLKIRGKGCLIDAQNAVHHATTHRALLFMEKYCM